MGKAVTISIDTRVDTSGAKEELGQFAAVVSKVFSTVTSIMGSISGKIKGIFNLGNIAQYLKQAMESATSFGEGGKVTEQFNNVAQTFSEKLTTLKIAVGEALMPIASMLMSVGSGLVSFLTSVATSIGDLTVKMFGMQEQTSNSSLKAAKGQTALAQATRSAGAAAKGALAAFDELNVLQIKSADGGGGGSGAKPDKPIKPDAPEEDDAELSFLEQLLKALEPLTEELFAGLRWGYENVLVPLSQWVCNDLMPAFLTAVGAAAEALAAILEIFKPAATWLWESFLQPLGEWTGEMVLMALGGISGAFEALALWIDENKEKLNALWQDMEPLFTMISELIRTILDSIMKFFGLWTEKFTQLLTAQLNLWMGLITLNWDQAWKAVLSIFEIAKGLLLGSMEILWETIKTGFFKALEAVKMLWAPIGEWFMRNVMEPLDKNFGWLWDSVILASRIAWQMVLGVWEPLSGWFMERVVTPVASFVKGMWEDIYGFFLAGVDKLKTTLTGYINFCLEMVEAGANMFIGIFNRIIDALNRISVEIPDWVPEYGGRSFGISIPNLPSVSIPKLATGAVIPPNAQFAAILGDQRAGRNLEAPEGLIREIVREEGGAREIVVRFEGSMAQLARVLAPAIEQENARQGTRLIFGGG